MSSIREQGIQNAVTKLNTSRPGGVPFFIRSLSSAVLPQDLPKNIVYPADDTQMDGQDLNTKGVRRLYHDIAVETIFKGDGVTAPDSLIDPILVWARKVLPGQVLPNVYMGIEYVTTKFVRAQADYPYCRAIAIFRIYYQNATKDPEAWALTA